MLNNLPIWTFDFLHKICYSFMDTLSMVFSYYNIFIYLYYHKDKNNIQKASTTKNRIFMQLNFVIDTTLIWNDKTYGNGFISIKIWKGWYMKCVFIAKYIM